MVDGANPVLEDLEHPLVMDPFAWKESPLIQELLASAGPVICENVETDPRVTASWRDYYKPRGTRKFLAVPVLIGGTVNGFIAVRHAERSPYRPEEVELTQALAHQVMLALRLTELAEQSQAGAILEERNRLARDVHDTLAQGFTGVIVQLEAAEDAMVGGHCDEADLHLRRAGDLARESLGEARRSVHALRPSALQHNNFWLALKGIIRNTTVGTALHTSFEVQGAVPDLPQSWQANLMHIGQEALTNALKYSHANHFGTRLQFNARELLLEFSDDGDGFNVKDGHDGLGLTGMRERIDQMGGELRITSNHGKGTRITAILPWHESSMS